ncbi:MAG: C40 family peptidase [Pseudomonadota bacterium]
MRCFIILGLLVTAGCSWEPKPQYAPERPEVVRSVPTISAPDDTRSLADDRAVIAASIAQQQLGVPYQYGGADPRGFDCSGLVHYAYAEAGMHVPRTTGALWREVTIVDRDQPQPGDILFFNFDGKPSHVGIYLGDQYFVHAPSTGRHVTTESLVNDYYRARLLRVGRLID